MLKSVERYCTPKICATRALVSGTVPSQVSPSTTANAQVAAGDGGTAMNAAIATARTA